MSYDDKSYVGMDCCPICNEPRAILLHKQLRKTINKYNFTSPELCDKCLKQAKEEGWFILYECDPEQVGKKIKHNFTGRYLKMRMEGLDKAYPNYNSVEKCRFACADLETFENLIKDMENKDENVS